jgi:ankyrin repeat protein
MCPELKDIVSRFFAAESREVFMSWIQVLNSNWIFKWNEYPRHATPLYYAASFGLVDVVEELMKGGADLDAPGSRFGGTALHGATLRQHVPIMKLLLKAGAAPSRAGFNRVTPLHTAVVYGNAEVIGLLLEFGAAKDATDTLGETLYNWDSKAGQTIS